MHKLFDPVILLLGVYLVNALTRKMAWVQAILSSIVCNNKGLWQQPECPSIGNWLNELWDVHILEYHATVKMKKELVGSDMKKKKSKMFC